MDIKELLEGKKDVRNFLLSGVISERENPEGSTSAMGLSTESVLELHLVANDTSTLKKIKKIIDRSDFSYDNENREFRTLIFDVVGQWDADALEIALDKVLSKHDLDYHFESY